MSTNLFSLIVMFCSGVAVCAVIDCFRYIIRTINWTPLRKIATPLELLIWTFLGCATFYLLLVVKNGDWRVIDSLAQIAGIFSYNFIFYKIIRLIGMVLVNIFITPIFVVGHFFARIIYKIIKLFVKILKGIIKLFQKKEKSSAKHLS